MNDLEVVRFVWGKKPEGKTWYGYIPDGGMNDIIGQWHSKQVERDLSYCSPSKITTCPRVIWLRNHGVKETYVQGWGLKQRMLLGRNFENKIAEQLDDEGALLYHWKDDPGEEDKSFTMGEGETLVKGTPDLLLRFGDTVVISDAKTSRSDSFGYLPTDFTIFEDGGWYKYKLQLTTYFLLCHANADWFKEHNLPLPTACHLFSFALDDGIVRREYTWIPSDEDIATVKQFIIRFNRSLALTACPSCECTEWDTKFCPYAITKGKSKVGSTCCDDSLIIKGE